MLNLLNCGQIMLYMSLPLWYLLRFASNRKFEISSLSLTLFYLTVYYFIYRERGRVWEREGKKHPCVRETLIKFASCTHPNQGVAHKLTICPDWELNQQPFALWGDVQPTEPYRSGQHFKYHNPKILLRQDFSVVFVTPVLKIYAGGLVWVIKFDSR